jgi:hypothetical protein
MGNTAILAIRIIGDARAAISSINSVDDAVARSARNFRLASAGAAIFFGALLIGGIQAEAVASDLQQAAGAVDAVFKEAASGIHDAADRASQDVGLARDQYDQLASILGAQLKNLGVSQDNLGDSTKSLITLGADLSAMYGGTASDAVNALSSLLRGERDPIERYGVSIKQADINAREAALGLTGLTGEAKKQADLQATLSILYDQTADASGRFAAEADTASGAQQRANAAWRDAQASLGEALLPIVSEGATLLAEFAHWVDENHQLVVTLAIVLGVLAAALVVLTAAQWAFNVAALANPVGLVILAIALAIGVLVALVVLVIQHWKDIERWGQEAWANITNFVNDAAVGIEDFINLVIDAINWLIKLGSGQFLSNDIADLLGVGQVNYAPQISHVDFANKDTAKASAAGSSVTNNITVTGAVDVDGTARTIKRVLGSSGAGNGLQPAAGGGAW